MNLDKIKAARFTVYDTPVKFSIEHYQSGGRVSLQLITDDDMREPYATLTVNIEEANFTLADDEIIVKAWSENEKVAEAALATGVFKDTGRRIPAGYVKAQVWKVL